MERSVRLLRLVIPAAALVVALAGSAPAARSGRPGFDSVVYTGKQAPVSRARAAVSWCGSGESATDRTPEVELSAPEQVHVVYAVPSDGADAFSAYSSRIASDAEAVDAWWRGQDPSRTWRFDLYAFPGCTSRFGMLDISVVRLPQASSYYGVDLVTRMQRLTTDFHGLFGPRVKTLVYYDGPVPEPDVCGTAWQLPPNGPNDVYGFGFVWLRSQCPNDVGTGGFAALAAAHEMTHNLGAFTSPGAPHECPSPHQGHACDSPVDLMFWAGSSGSRLGTELLDVGRDDYYGHSNAALVDVQDSPWLSHLPQLPLTIGTRSANGRAAGTVQPCSPCTVQLDNGLQFSVRATPAPGSRLVRWEGACSGAGACTVTMDGPKSVTAVFGPELFTLSVSVAGRGRVVSAPPGLACSSRCSHRFEAGASVRLSTRPARGFRFAGWSGSCRGKGACTLVADRDRSARARFVRRRS